jgi:hypothetical protein
MSGCCSRVHAALKAVLLPALEWTQEHRVRHSICCPVEAAETVIGCQVMLHCTAHRLCDDAPACNRYTTCVTDYQQLRTRHVSLQIQSVTV